MFSFSFHTQCFLEYKLSVKYEYNRYSKGEGGCQIGLGNRGNRVYVFLAVDSFIQQTFIGHLCGSGEC